LKDDGMPKTMKALIKKEKKVGLWMGEVPVPEIGPLAK
jgi:hypothetical protein